MASRLVADTDVLSYIFKGGSLAEPYRRLMRGCEVHLSFVTVAELRRWGMENGWGDDRKRDLEFFIDGFDILHSDDDACTCWARVISAARTYGRPLSQHDAWIAASAYLLDCPILTHNAKDYSGCPFIEVLTVR